MFYFVAFHPQELFCVLWDILTGDMSCLDKWAPRLQGSEELHYLAGWLHPWDTPILSFWFTDINHWYKWPEMVNAILIQWTAALKKKLGDQSKSTTILVIKLLCRVQDHKSHWKNRGLKKLPYAELLFRRAHRVLSLDYVLPSQPSASGWSSWVPGLSCFKGLTFIQMALSVHSLVLKNWNS